MMPFHPVLRVAARVCKFIKRVAKRTPKSQATEGPVVLISPSSVACQPSHHNASRASCSSISTWSTTRPKFVNRKSDKGSTCLEKSNCNGSYSSSRSKSETKSRDRRALVALACSGPDAESALENAINEILELRLSQQGFSERVTSFCVVDLDG